MNQKIELPEWAKNRPDLLNLASELNYYKDFQFSPRADYLKNKIEIDESDYTDEMIANSDFNNNIRYCEEVYDKLDIDARDYVDVLDPDFSESEMFQEYLFCNKVVNEIEFEEFNNFIEALTGNLDFTCCCGIRFYWENLYVYVSDCTYFWYYTVYDVAKPGEKTTHLMVGDTMYSNYAVKIIYHYLETGNCLGHI